MIAIARLTFDDAERFRKIRLASLWESPEAFGSTYQQMASLPSEAWHEQLRNLPTFVAVQDGQDAGVIRSVMDPGQPDTAHLISMWVAPEARGHGIGGALVDAVADWARSQGLKQLVLDVIEDNEPAIALYRRKGFKPTGESNAFPPPREHIVEIRMAMSL